MIKVNGGGNTGIVPNANPAPAQRTPAPAAQKNVLNTETRFDAPRRSAPVALDAVAPRSTAPAGWVTPEDVDRISAMTDGVARNYQITQGYADLSAQTAQLLGKDNANWATFGVWASRQAGTSIRGEDLPRFMVDALHALPGLAQAEAKVNSHLKAMGLPQLPAVPDLLLKSSAAQKQLCDALAGGNRAVFAEIGREFATFNQTFKGADHYDQAQVDAYLKHFTPEQAKLKDGFAAYAKAMFEPDPKKKAELMLYANDQIGADEQWRLQGYIDQAMNCGKPVFQEAIQGAVDKALSHLPGPLKWLANKELQHFGGVDKLTDAADAAFRHAATQMMMRLSTPNENLHLGQDLPNPPGLSTPFPKDLMDIQNPDLKAVLSQLDHSPNSLHGTAATDWTSFQQRMDYIGDLFRSRQQDPSLWNPPFPTRPALVA